MHPRTVKKVLADEVTLDVALTAKAVQEENARLRTKKNKKTSRLNSLKLHMQWLAQQGEDEKFRQRVAAAWNKHKKV